MKNISDWSEKKKKNATLSFFPFEQGGVFLATSNGKPCLNLWLNHRNKYYFTGRAVGRVLSRAHRYHHGPRHFSHSQAIALSMLVFTPMPIASLLQDGCCSTRHHILTLCLNVKNQGYNKRCSSPKGSFFQGGHISRSFPYKGT